MLVDADPYGVEIASVYKYGSKCMTHDAENLTCSRAELIGLDLAEAMRYFPAPKERHSARTLKETLVWEPIGITCFH